MHPNDGRIVVFSAPSGAGKTTIVNRLVQRFDFLRFAVSATTRLPREGERHGREYYFFSPEEFKERVVRGEFVEHEEVYPGCFYGTLASEIERIWAEGYHVIADVDVKGGLALKDFYGDRVLGVFVDPPSVAALEARLGKRATESEQARQERVERAGFELSLAPRFDRRLLNDDLEKAVEEACELLEAFLPTVSP